MALHKFVTIDGHRHDITDQAVTQEPACDRCGTFMATAALICTVINVVDPTGTPVDVDICATCSSRYFPGLADLAVKVLGSV